MIKSEVAFLKKIYCCLWFVNSSFLESWTKKEALKSSVHTNTNIRTENPEIVISEKKKNITVLGCCFAKN